MATGSGSTKQYEGGSPDLGGGANAGMMVPGVVMEGAEAKLIEKVTTGAGDMVNEKKTKVKKGKASTRKTTRDLERKMKHADLPEIAHALMGGNMRDALAFIKKFDPSNLSGAFRPSLDIMKKLLNNTDPMQALKGMIGSNFYSILMNAIAQSNSGSGSAPSGPKPNEACLIFDLPGHLQYFPLLNNTLVCVPDKPPFMTDIQYQNYLKTKFVLGIAPTETT